MSGANLKMQYAGLKVLHVIPALAARYGGPSQAVLEMCRQLTAAGSHVMIASTDADGPARLPVPLEQAIDYQGVPTIFFRRQWSEAFKYSRPLTKWLCRHVRDFDALHIHAVFSHASMAAAAAAREARVPYVVRPLGSLNPWALRHKPLRKCAFWHAGIRTMLRQAAMIHYTSDAERRQAEPTLGLARGVVVPLGVYVDASGETNGVCSAGSLHVGQAPPEAGNYVLALGRLHPVKGLELLIESFVDVVNRGLKGWTLKLVGDGDPKYVGQLKRRVRQLSADHLIEFAGWLTGEEKEAALRGASLLAMPSHQENFGVAMFEALARGVPVLVSDEVDWAQDIAAAGAGWTSPLDGVSLASALAVALASPTDRAARGSAGQELVRERFVWPVIAAQLQQCYQGIVAGVHVG